MDPKGRLSSQIHFLVPLGITYSDSLLCGNTLDQIYHKRMLNLTYWDSGKVDNMQLHGWKELKTSVTIGMAELVNTASLNVMWRH